MNIFFVINTSRVHGEDNDYMAQTTEYITNIFIANWLLMNFSTLLFRQYICTAQGKQPGIFSSGTNSLWEKSKTGQTYLHRHDLGMDRTGLEYP